MEKRAGLQDTEGITSQGSPRLRVSFFSERNPLIDIRAVKRLDGSQLAGSIGARMPALRDLEIGGVKLL
jgi:hypothetical protein